jgi:hypothetical protein
MQSAEARGGPVKFKKQLKEQQQQVLMRRTPSSRSMLDTEPLGSTSRRSSLGSVSEVSEKIAEADETVEESAPVTTTPFLTDAPPSPVREDQVVVVVDPVITAESEPAVAHSDPDSARGFQKLKTIFSGSGDGEDAYPEPFEEAAAAPLVTEALSVEIVAAPVTPSVAPAEEAAYEEELFETVVDVVVAPSEEDSLRLSMSSSPRTADQKESVRCDQQPHVSPRPVESLSSDPVYEEDFDGDVPMSTPLEVVPAAPPAPQFGLSEQMGAESLLVPESEPPLPSAVDESYQDDFVEVTEEVLPTMLLGRGDSSVKAGREDEAVRNNYLDKEEVEEEIRDDTE